jgi:coenzyme F420 hydrogenase subunit beta
MTKANLLFADKITEDEAIKMHSHGYDFKKRGSFIRINFRKLTGKKIPDYGYKISGFGASRIMMEMIISSMFVMMSTGLARWTVEQFPPGFIGNLFEKARTAWKNSTKKIKRRDLN